MYFHRTAPGGCCDCGDEEAWADDGCCTRHKQPTGDKAEADPLSTLPQDFQVASRLKRFLCCSFGALVVVEGGGGG